MATKSSGLKGSNDTLSTLDVAIQDLHRAKEACGVPPAQVAFASVGDLLTMTADSVAPEQDYVDIGLFCADVCRTLDRGLSGRHLNELSRPVRGAIEELTTTVANMQRKLVKKGKRNAISRRFYEKVDKCAIAAWRQDLNRILQIFNTELLMNNHMMLLDIHRNALASQEGARNPLQLTQVSMSPGEFPPPPPGACFGRDGLIEKVVGLAENLNSIALIGPGGIGKTSVALVILHCDRIKDRFGDNRRFVRCDQFPPSRAHLLSRLSKVIGAGVENPEDLVPLRPHLSSKEMLVVLDNAESILDPQGPDGQDIYRLVEELSRFNNICLVVTSRITTIPPNCETIEVPTLSMEAACNAFYGIYKHGDRLEAIDNILKQLDFHPLSVTLLATVAHQNKWDDNRLAREWEQRQTGVLRTQHNESLAAAVELSLASPMFQTLGPDARELLGVIAFFPQGINENDLDRLFPTISDIATIFDKFCILSLTYRSNGFITMLVPLQDYLRPKDPFSSSLLLTTKEFYFTRMSIKLDRNAPKLREMQWITSEDVNVEHLLNVFTSVDSKSDGVWSACISFFYHLIWLKPRRTLLGTKIDGLPDDHPSKPECLFWLAWLLDVVGDCAGRKQLLTQALKLEMERGNEYRAAVTLGHLSDANRQLGLYKEGIRQMEEVLGACERIGNAGEHGEALMNLALLLYEDGQLDAAEEVASRAIALLPEKAQGLRVCRSHHTLGKIYHSKGEREKAIHHFKAALKIMSLSDWNDQLFWIHFDLALLFHDGDEFDDAHTHVERAKTHAVSNAYHLGRAVLLQARIHRQQSKLQDATSGALRALEIFEKLGTMSEVGICKDLLKLIEGAASCQNACTKRTIKKLGKCFSKHCD